MLCKLSTILVTEDAKREPNSQSPFLIHVPIQEEEEITSHRTEVYAARQCHSAARRNATWDVSPQHRQSHHLGRAACRILTFLTNEFNMSQSSLTVSRPVQVLVSSEGLVPRVTGGE